MSNEYYAINRGQEGFKISDFTIGTSTSASSDIELRVATVDANGKTMTRKDIHNALKSLMRVLESGASFTNFPPL
jgi:hypothetical protein